MDAKNTIFIIDDAPEEILILQDLLSRSYSVQTASDGRQALAYLEGGGAADLILTDVMMPRMDGFEFCDHLKAIPRLRDCPVIFLTGLDSAADEECALSLGAADFIHKPVSPPVMLARVRNHLEFARMRKILREQNRSMEKAEAG